MHTMHNRRPKLFCAFHAKQSRRVATPPYAPPHDPRKMADPRAQAGGMAHPDTPARDLTVVPPHPLTDLAVTIDRLQRRALTSYMTDMDKTIVRDGLPVLRALLEALVTNPAALSEAAVVDRYREAVQADRIAAVLLLEKKETD